MADKGANSGLRVIQVCSARNIVYGAVRSMMALGDGLKTRGETVSYLTFAGRGAGPALRELGETVFEAKVRFKIDPFGIVQMARIIRSQKCDIVHTHLSTSSTNGALAARLARVPSVATVHGLSGKLSFAFADRLIAVSEEVKRHLVRQGMPEHRIDVVHNGISFPEVPAAVSAEIRAQLGIADAFPVVGTVARVTELKGIEFALQAFALLKKEFPKAAYLVLGDGDRLAACRELSASLGVADSVHFLGYQSPVEPYLAAMDLLAFPSLKEAMGIALVEAAGQGLPAVATDVGGIPEVVTAETGILVPARDSEALFEGLRRLASDDALRVQISAAARDRAHRLFSQPAMVNATLDVYGRVMGSRKAGPVKLAL